MRRYPKLEAGRILQSSSGPVRLLHAAMILFVFSLQASLLSAINPTESGAVGPSGASYQYAGKVSSGQWLGVAADISVDTEIVSNSTESHILNYVDMQFNGTCSGQGSCWIQVGNELGYTGSPGISACHSTGIEAYVEESDVNAYHCGAYPTIPLAQTDFYSIYNYGAGCNSSGEGIITGWIYNGSTFYRIGTAYFPECPALSTLYAQTEFAENHVGYPTLRPYQYFGYNTTRVLQQSANGKTWSAWTASQTHGPYPPLNLTPRTVDGHDRFITWG